jgi:FtsP/CotA-like multicopper oxidase with cupredoxin domain
MRLANIIRLIFVLMLFWAVPSYASHVQCPGDINGDGISDDPDILCVHLAAGDGFIKMADGSDLYIFGFSDVTGVPESSILSYATLKQGLPAPTLELKEEQDFYLSVTNVGMMMRPDLFDPHSVHFHGFVNAAPVFDGEPMASFGIAPLATFTYYFKPVEPGTYMYHCHVEATEHMQMGMLGNVYIKPAQDGTSIVYNGKPYTKFAYNDGDGSTGYDVSYPIQIHAMDSRFHEQSISVQPLDFAGLKDNYFMFNGRGYPDTINPSPIYNMDGNPSQMVSSLIEANQGDRILLRISNLSFDFYTVSVPGIPMIVVGKDAKLLRSKTGENLYITTTSVNLGGGQTADVILDTTDVPKGTYFLYTTNLYGLSNNEEELGGMMTEIHIQ